MSYRKFMVIGGGGREHALTWKLAQSSAVEHVWVAPGNAGTALEQKTSNIDLEPTNITAIIEFAQAKQIDCLVIGPEAALAAGITDAAQAAGISCFGATQAAAQLESSKSFAKQFMRQHNIPTANYAEFTDHAQASQYLKSQTYPQVIKADGLAAGKGVIIAQNQTEAQQAIDEMLQQNRFGEAGARIIIEEFLTGEELSFIVVADGEHFVSLATSQDHKRRDTGDLGPNTGGMGAYSPVPISTQLHTTIERDIIAPTIAGMKAAGHPYNGFLYAGLMIDNTGNPKVLEFNCRLGDPETQPILMRLKSNLDELIYDTLNNKLTNTKLQWDNRTALTVVMAAGGYPGPYTKGSTITGLNEHSITDSYVFHAGTTTKGEHIVTSGGRVLGVTALGNSIKQAQQHAYSRCAQIHWPDCFYRTDIGWRASEHDKLQPN